MINIYDAFVENSLFTNLVQSKNGENFVEEYSDFDAVFCKDLDFGLKNVAGPESAEGGVPLVALQVQDGLTEFCVFRHLLVEKGLQLVLGELRDRVLDEGGEVFSAEGVSCDPLPVDVF